MDYFLGCDSGGNIGHAVGAKVLVPAYSIKTLASDIRYIKDSM